jgi:hypothetical protein
VKRGECQRREYSGECSEGGAEVMELNGIKWEVIISLTTLLTAYMETREQVCENVKTNRYRQEHAGDRNPCEQ